MDRKLKRWELALMAGVLFTLTVSCWLGQEQQELADRVIRFHVIANSDSPEDQELKLAVRDSVLAATQAFYPEGATLEEARSALEGHLAVLAAAGRETVEAWGCDYPVTASLEETWFPTRQYQGAALPAGDYLALRVLIGAAAGHNWWCVVFPSLCLPAVSETTQPAAALTQENYALITEEGAGYTFRFHLVEWWEGLKHWLAEE